MWSVAASGPSSLTVALIAAAATLVGAIVAGGAKYLADLRLDRQKALTEARIAARLVYDDLTQVSEAVSDVHLRVKALLGQLGSIAIEADLLEGDEHLVRILEREGATETAGVSNESHEQRGASVRQSLGALTMSLSDLSEAPIETPAWVEHRTALAQAMEGDRWLIVTKVIAGISEAKQAVRRLAPRALENRSWRVQLKTVLDDSKLEKQLHDVAFTLNMAAAWIPRGLDALEPLASMGTRVHAFRLWEVRTNRDRWSPAQPEAAEESAKAGDSTLDAQVSAPRPPGEEG